LRLLEVVFSVVVVVEVGVEADEVDTVAEALVVVEV
jgi:hypothetical protein